MCCVLCVQTTGGKKRYRCCKREDVGGGKKRRDQDPKGSKKRNGRALCRQELTDNRVGGKRSCVMFLCGLFVIAFFCVVVVDESYFM